MPEACKNYILNFLIGLELYICQCQYFRVCHCYQTSGVTLDILILDAQILPFVHPELCCPKNDPPRSLTSLLQAIIHRSFSRVTIAWLPGGDTSRGQVTIRLSNQPPLVMCTGGPVDGNPTDKKEIAMPFFRRHLGLAVLSLAGRILP
jgi:hypothetical protein